ncbi:PH domain-containing protein [Streptomyces sp. NPDC018693]|uniref:PH domain-containing protein n=1 Tax=unclassified Streptomyces TaxID=2593676 RepID=UPI00378DE64B
MDGVMDSAADDVICRWGPLRMSGDAYGLRCRTLLRRWSVPWDDVAEVRVHLRHVRGRPSRQVGVLLQDGRRRRLPLPWSGTRDGDPDFDATVEALRALHRRHGGTPATGAAEAAEAADPGPVPVVSDRTAGRGRAGTLTLCLVLLACAAVAALFVPQATAQKRAWQAAVPCSAGAPGRECLISAPAVIERTDPQGHRQRSWLYFTGGRPTERLSVDEEAARAFRAGDRVEVTVWRGEVREVSSDRHVWREHFPGGGEVAVIATACALAAGYPAALLLVRRRGRRLADDEVLPSALPFAAPLVGTALWLLPLAYRHPLTVFSDPAALTWAAAGSLASLLLLTWAWHATRVRPPGPADQRSAPSAGPAFLPARFLESTDYNPHHFGTHIALGDGPPAVTPGRDRFAARAIPAERLTLKEVRRVRGADGDTVSRSWHIAELDDAGQPVRLAAAPADLTRILNELRLTRHEGASTRA